MPSTLRRLWLASGLTAALTLAAALMLSPWLAVLVALAAAFLVAWRISVPFSRRLNAVIKLATHYASADLSRWPGDYGDDEVGRLIRAMDEAVQERKRRLSEFARHRARMEAILAGMAEGVLVVDRQGHVQLINDAAQRLLSGRVAVGDHYIETVRHPSVVVELTAALRGEHPDPLEVALESDRRSLLAHATPASESAGGGAVLVLHDITALRTADRIRRDFVANVSHELRTPLTAVRGYLEALDDDALTLQERREFLDVIRRHTARMERLVRDLLRLARIEAGQEAPDLGPCQTEAMFRSVTAELAGPIQARNLSMETHVTLEAATLVVDGAKLHDVLRNVIENAINYSPDGGRIELQARIEDEHVALAIGDEGPGIPDSDLARVFERFYRVDKSRTRDATGAHSATIAEAPGGTGLGLSIAKHLVEAHGGRITVENRQPHGALFTIYLPHEA